MKSNSDVRPSILQDLGDDSRHYNYNIKEVPVTTESGEEKTAFEYETVLIWGKPDYETLANAVIAEHYSPPEETALINKYNAFSLKLSIDPADKEKYETYLKKVSDLKAMIKVDLRALGLMSPEPARTLEQTIVAKIAEIDAYDNSDEVNSFLFNEQKTWIDAGTRAVFRNSIDSAELLQEETIQLPIAGVILTVPVSQAKIMLARIQRYADNASIVTTGHKIAVSSFNSISQVDDYNFKTGYPEKEAFNI
ncbi:MAG: hypothetical protein LBS07_01520 [Prevotellaceae bacterium]|jgi:hypothetical protein|nr:hypothetical protein [Prevotellaceae bacterium]